MAETLTVVAVETIETLIQGLARRAGKTEPPFPEDPGGVACVLETTGEGVGSGGQRVLALGLDFFVAADRSMPGVEPGHQNGAGRRTHGRSTIVPSETHPASRQMINMRRFEMLLSVAAEIAVAQIIG